MTVIWISSFSICSMMAWSFRLDWTVGLVSLEITIARSFLKFSSEASAHTFFSWVGVSSFCSSGAGVCGGREVSAGWGVCSIAVAFAGWGVGAVGWTLTSVFGSAFSSFLFSVGFSPPVLWDSFSASRALLIAILYAMSGYGYRLRVLSTFPKISEQWSKKSTSSSRCWSM